MDVGDDDAFDDFDDDDHDDDADGDDADTDADFLYEVDAAADAVDNTNDSDAIQESLLGG